MLPNIRMVSGLPGSGKSTYVDEYSDPISDIVMSTDDTIQEICDDHEFTYNEGFSSLIDFATKVYNKDVEFVNKYHENIIGSIWIDQTNLSAKSRMKKLAQFKFPSYNTCYYFPLHLTNSEEWVRRLNSREGKTIPDNVMSSMLSQYQPPTYSEGWDQIFKVDEDGTHTLMENN